MTVSMNRIKEQRQRYRRSAKGKATAKRWRDGEVRKAWLKRNRERVKAAQKRYNNTDHGKATTSAIHKRYHQKHPELRKAHRAVRIAIKNGHLRRQPCSVCGQPNAQAHHPDYTKPLEVIWLCPCHHMEAHWG